LGSNVSSHLIEAGDCACAIVAGDWWKLPYPKEKYICIKTTAEAKAEADGLQD
jgi:hypothetical protein